ncbi:DNA polymerase III subunit beta [bacterium]|jgi:DNA polymerase-3 subunit beta|nr:DNA polymerase III subunit beta [bacterium]MDP6659774.1 DNA polymerase III subunit beta [Candidatus Paceibacterota bacterium]|tara:strand:+ start:3367 stop:4470 length:1104 start_codon:yes stop_codon:yes gene_type:complete
MKVSCLKEDLLIALNYTERIAGTNPTLPILNCVLLKINKSFKIYSTNLDLAVEVSVPGDISGEGSAAVPATLLYTTVQNTNTNNPITLEIKENNLLLSTKEGKTTIKTLPVDDFPIPTKQNSKKTLNLDKNQLINGVNSVVYSASNTTIKPELASVYIYQNQNNLIFVSTDSFRLAEKKIPNKTEGSVIDPTIIPYKNATEVVRIISNSKEDNISVLLNEAQAIFSIENVIITSRLINGTFPDYKQIIPKTSTTEVVSLKQDLLTALKKVNIFSDRFNQASFHIYPKKKTFTVSARSDEVGETFDDIDASITGEDLDINFNNRYVSDVFSSINSDSMSLSFSGLGKPLIIKGVSDESFLYLVMPMNR